MKEFKGEGEHSVNELESICSSYKERLHQKQLVNQELLEALQGLVSQIGNEHVSEFMDHPLDYAKIIIKKAL